MRHEVNTVEAKNRFNELLAKVERSRNPIVIERRGKAVAVLIDYPSYISQKKKRTSQGPHPTAILIQQLHRHLKKKYPQGTGDSLAILKELREERSL
jgi:prevent-host-death family protein